MRRSRSLAMSIALVFGAIPRATPAQQSGELLIRKVEDFQLEAGSFEQAWTGSPWIAIPQRKIGKLEKTTKAKVVYSATGLYFMVDCEDTVLTAGKMTADFDDLWTEDVVEVFLMPEESFPVYFEYEISPLGLELPIMVPNNGGKFLGWRPWNYEGGRKVRKLAMIFPPTREFGSAIERWIVKFFIPFDLLRPLGKNPPVPGDRWRANIYRIDYDGGEVARWEWRPVGPSFHEFEKFGTFVFGE